MKFTTNPVNVPFAKSAIAIAFSLNLINVSANDDVEDTVVVTASKYEQSINDVLANVTVITREEIELSQAATIVDVIAKYAGVDMVEQGSKGQSASLFMRGTNSDHTLILVDGVRVGSATLGAKQINAIPTTQIDRIEIIRGPRSVVWGADAIGGVIHIITRKMNDGELAVSATLGENNYYKAAASAGFGNEDNRFSITASHEAEDGFSAINFKGAGEDDYQENDNDGFKINSLLMRGDFNLSDAWSLGVALQQDEGETEFDSSGANEGEFRNTLLNAVFKHSTDAWKNTVAIGHSIDNLESMGADYFTDAPYYYAFETTRDHLNFHSAYQINEQYDVFGGIDWYDESVDIFGLTYAKEKRDVQAGYVGVAYSDNQWLGDFAVRSDDVEGVASEVTYNAGLGYFINEQWLLSGNLSSGFKAPTFNDLYYPDGGNANLVSETSDNKEIAAVFNQGAINVEFAIYQSDIDNLIEWAPTVDDPWVWTPQNIASADIFGQEIIAKLDAGYATHELQISYINAEDGRTGKQLIRRAKERVSYQIDMPLSDWSFIGQVQYTGKRPDVQSELDSYVIANLNVKYQFSDALSILFKLNNLFDESYSNATWSDWTSGNTYKYNTPGREWYIGFSYKNF